MIPSGKYTWQSPSNIAIVKYWGKCGHQIPCNPSISMTLANSYSETKVQFRPKEIATQHSFLFEGKPAPAFEKRVFSFLQSMEKELPFLSKMQLKISSRNSFPHSVGIASSASFMSSLALCLCSIENEIKGNHALNANFFKRASHIARLGSGSASRSVYGQWVLWGENEYVKNSSNHYATEISHLIHKSVQNYHDAILVVSTNKKPVSSTEGHKLMDGLPTKDFRYKEAYKNTKLALEALEIGDHFALGEIIESEAMQLHALFMQSKPWFLLMQANSINIINKVRAFRKSQNIPVFFTLDAGPNIHLLYPQKYRKEVLDFIENELLQFCENRQWIDDKIGTGPNLILD